MVVPLREAVGVREYDRVGTSAHPTRISRTYRFAKRYDIISKQKRRPHKLTPFAQVTGTCMTYPPQRGEQLGLDW